MSQHVISSHFLLYSSLSVILIDLMWWFLIRQNVKDAKEWAFNHSVARYHRFAVDEPITIENAFIESERARILKRNKREIIFICLHSSKYKWIVESVFNFRSSSEWKEQWETKKNERFRSLNMISCARNDEHLATVLTGIKYNSRSSERTKRV